MNDLQSICDGLFYPADPAELDETVEKILSETPEPDLKGTSIAVPHGAYNICGEFYGKGYRSLEKINPYRIIIIAPVHRECKDGIFLTEKEGISIPGKRIVFDKTGKKIMAEKTGSLHMGNTLP